MAKILFIEDDPLIVKIYTTRLTTDGHEVYSAENGEEGIKLAQEKLPDLVVLDIMMPRLDGFAVLEKIRAHGSLKATPVLVYSNLAQDEEVARAQKMGATEFIVKANLSPTEMVEKIKQYLPKAGGTSISANQPQVASTQHQSSQTQGQSVSTSSQNDKTQREDTKSSE